MFWYLLNTAYVIVHLFKDSSGTTCCYMGDLIAICFLNSVRECSVPETRDFTCCYYQILYHSQQMYNKQVKISKEINL